MTPTAHLVIKYAAFCVIAMAMNLGAQYLTDVFLAPPLWLSMGIGTAVGLVAKYILDRKYIFNARGATASKDAQRFVIYTMMGIITTLVFWGTEWAFAALLSFSSAKYIGGAIGLTAGYVLKYHLDKRWVFCIAKEQVISAQLQRRELQQNSIVEKTPRLSLALFVYNHAEFLPEALDSIFQQTRLPDEILICDDGSTDKSLEVIQRHSSLNNFSGRYVLIAKKENEGLAEAINSVAKVASGDIIVFSAGDDVSDPERVELLAKAFDSKTMFICSRASLIDAFGNSIGNQAEAPDGETISFKLGNYIMGDAPNVLGATCAYRREVFSAFGKLNPKILQEDIILPYRALIKGEGRYLSRALVRYRVHAGNVHFSGAKQSAQRLVATAKKLTIARGAIFDQLKEDVCASSDIGNSLKNKLHKKISHELSLAEYVLQLQSANFFLWRLAVGTLGLIRHVKLAPAATRVFVLFVFPNLYASMMKTYLFARKCTKS